MPLPKPQKDETQDEFIGRCMTDEVMKDEFKDTNQRLAVCFSLWRKEKTSLDELMERRSYPVEIRATEERKIVGYAAVFNQESLDIGGFREIILPGAFKAALEKSDVRALWNHDPNIILGRTASGTLKLFEDDKGLQVEIDPPSWADPYLESIRRGDVSEMSMAFVVAKDEWADNKKLRKIIEFETIYDVSPVTYPAYPQTSVAVRLNETLRQNINDLIKVITQFEMLKGLDNRGVHKGGRVDCLDTRKRKLKLVDL